MVMLTLNDEGRVRSHVDMWSVRETLRAVPLLGFVYDEIWRPVFGKTSSIITNIIHSQVAAAPPPHKKLG
jgi:hypothetical protein